MKVNLKKSKLLKKEYNGQKFKIDRYISLGMKEAILTSAYNEYLKRVEESGGLIEAIVGVDADIQMMVVGACVKDLEFDKGVIYEDLLNSGFLYFVLDEIVNYKDIRDSAHDLIRLFVISERIPDIEQMSNIVPSEKNKMTKEVAEVMTEMVKNIA